MSIVMAGRSERRPVVRMERRVYMRIDDYIDYFPTKTFKALRDFDQRDAEVQSTMAEVPMLPYKGRRELLSKEMVQQTEGGMS